MLKRKVTVSLQKNPKEKKIIRAYVIKRAKNKKKERNNKEKSIESLN